MNQRDSKAKTHDVAVNLEDGGSHMGKNTAMGPQSSNPREPDS